ncbi:hypothetical protein AMATHDRAFT_61662 [Amanita thiersii Skay4041]|uniref:ubiquitinyl hydrolase 1 n=1 Tax=Amanita thiersii Skay4041 TaxID=703135 RepID=A0A2A9NR32_9AGAR|nr:hypothetical protein AMATHDRAFT_61662 [Amanita thiersii Skay4041]
MPGFADDLQASLIHLLSSSLSQQLAPFFVLFLTPLLVFFLASKAERSNFFYQFAMGLESLGMLAPWNWLSSTSSSGSAKGSSSGHHHHHHHHKRSPKKRIRTRMEQQQALANGSAKHDTEKVHEDEGHYPGLVNISGTYCFMNSTLQALASLSYLQPHIDAIHDKAEVLDVPTPIIDTLQELFRKLNTPRSSYHSIRPVEIIDALTNAEGRSNALFYSREHQDAQELFQLLSECIKNEITAVDKEGYKDPGLGGLSRDPETTRDIGKSVFDGLTANRRSCVACEYTEAVMHFALDNWQLAVPRFTAACRLEDCLEEYTHLEILRDCICRKCSLVATHRRLRQDVVSYEETTKPEANPSSSKKRRLKEVRRQEARVKAALGEGRIEDELKDIRMEKVISPATKQAMIARPPAVLALHINRSIHYTHYATKNSVRIVFPEVLDLTPYTTSGILSTKPTTSISTPIPSTSITLSSLPRRSTTPTPSAYSAWQQHYHSRTLYRLSAVVCHYGAHSFGHYICYRRKPRPASMSKDKRWAPPKLVDPLLLFDADREDDETSEGDDDKRGKRRHRSPRYIWDGEDPADYGPGTGRGWLRISDDAVSECGIENVLAEGSGAFMLYYERVVLDVPSVYGNGGGEKGREGRSAAGEGTLRVSRNGKGREVQEDGTIGTGKGIGSESEETLRPRMKTVVMNGSVDTLVSEVGVGVREPVKKPLSLNPPHLHDHSPASSFMSTSPMSTSAPPMSTGVTIKSSIPIVGPRIIRSVDPTRRRSVPLGSSPSSSCVSTPAVGSREPSVGVGVSSSWSVPASNKLKVNGDAASPASYLATKRKQGEESDWEDCTESYPSSSRFGSSDPHPPPTSASVSSSATPTRISSPPPPPLPSLPTTPLPKTPTKVALRETTCPGSSTSNPNSPTKLPPSMTPRATSPTPTTSNLSPTPMASTSASSPKSTKNGGSTNSSSTARKRKHPSKRRSPR